MTGIVTSKEYADFSAGLYDKTFASGVPSHGHFELTFRCALKCGFCYCSCYTSDEHVRRELGTQEVLRILDEAADGGCLWITFSGGDPFLRRDFREIYDHAIGRGLIVSIFCSGLVLTDDWLRHLAEVTPLKIELPLYGVTPEVYDAVSGRPGSFQIALKNIFRMIEANLPVKLKTKITRRNVGQVLEIERFLRDQLGLEFHPNYYLYPRLDGTRDHLEDRLTPGQVRELEKLISFEACESGSEAQASGMENPKLFRCAAGVNSFYVNPYGELNFCTYVREGSFDLRAGSLRAGMRKLRRELLELEYPAGAACRSCAIQSTCQNCPGHAVLETGKLDGRSDYLCEVNHALNGKELPR